jgi:hypothetical protein
MKEFIETIKRACKPLAIENHDNECIICYDSDGKIAELHLHTSFIKEFYHKGNRRDICPLRKYGERVSKEFPFIATESMNKGNFFETLCIGSNADGGGVYDLPKSKVNGTMTLDERRIRDQAEVFKMLVDRHGMMVVKEGPSKNTQVKACVEWTVVSHEDIKVFIHCTADLVSPLSFPGYEKDMCVIDLKLTKDMNSTFGEYGWGDMSRIDIFQAQLYSIVYQLPFAYLIFDYKKNPEHKIEPVNMNPNHEDPMMANEARLRIQETKMVISNMVDDLILYSTDGWYTNANVDNCKNCRNVYCPSNGVVQET